MTLPAVTKSTHAPPLVYDSASFRRFVTARNDVGEGDWRISQEVARRNGMSELRALLDLGYIGETTLADRIAAWSGCPRWSAEHELTQLSTSVPTEFMRANSILAFDDATTSAGEADGVPSQNNGVRLVVADPSDRFAWSGVVGRFGGRITAVTIATQKEIGAFLDEQLSSRDGDRAVGADDVDVSGEISALRDMASEAPVVRFFNQTVERAMELGASDIHLERFDRRISLRFRVDGILIEQPPPALRMYDPLLCRIKILSNLDIAERRRAQDGRIRLRLRGRQVDLRVSIVPTMYGQDAAIRLQDRQKLAEVDFKMLGFQPKQVSRLLAVASKSHGILLITGPTGSGKTTTLYAILRQIVNSERKIITVEDPVEYAMEGVNQIQLNAAVNQSFGNMLRHILRHDPDVILIGEIRDRETAEIAFQAALTGHMVLSTLHTNDVPGSFVRLIDMGVEPYLVNAAVEGVAAQRLLRKICTECRNEPERRQACAACAGLGYRGRVAVSEQTMMTSAVKKALLDGAEEHRIREVLLADGFESMRVAAERMVREGITDEAEVSRVLGMLDADVADSATGELA